MQPFFKLNAFIQMLTLCGLCLLAGCAGLIKGVSNSNLYGPLPPTGTFAIRLLEGDPLIGKKIERMIYHEVSKQGYKLADSDPDLLVSYAFDVSPAGSVSTATTSVRTAPQTAYILGNTVQVNPSTSYASTSFQTTNLYRKTIAVRISNAKTGEKIWESNVSEQGWCNQIFVTAPSILALMFEGFPAEQTNVNKTVSHSDKGTRELMHLFPSNTSWGC